SESDSGKKKKCALQSANLRCHMAPCVWLDWCRAWLAMSHGAMCVWIGSLVLAAPHALSPSMALDVGDIQSDGGDGALQGVSLGDSTGSRSRASARRAPPATPHRREGGVSSRGDGGDDRLPRDAEVPRRPLCFWGYICMCVCLQINHMLWLYVFS